MMIGRLDKVKMMSVITLLTAHYSHLKCCPMQNEVWAN